MSILSFRLLRNIFFVSLVSICACTSKQDIRRDQDIERLKKELKELTGTRADTDTLAGEVREELSRTTSFFEGQIQAMRSEIEGLKKEISDIKTKPHEKSPEPAVTAQPVTEEKEVKSSEPVLNYAVGKKLFDSGKFLEAVDVFKKISTKKQNSEDKRRTKYYLAESLFQSKDYVNAALEFADFRKTYAKDSLASQALYRQVQCFQGLGKDAEAKLFYQELLEKYPKSAAAQKAKSEFKK